MLRPAPARPVDAPADAERRELRRRSPAAVQELAGVAPTIKSHRDHVRHREATSSATGTPWREPPAILLARGGGVPAEGSAAEYQLRDLAKHGGIRGHVDEQGRQQ